MPGMGPTPHRIMQRLIFLSTNSPSMFPHLINCPARHFSKYSRPEIQMVAHWMRMKISQKQESDPLFPRFLSTTYPLAKDAGTTASGGGKEGEQKITTVLRKAFPTASKLRVEDISGGCGSMYQVLVESKDFEGLSIVKQHQLVNKALKEEIKDMHGIRIQTQPPKS